MVTVPLSALFTLFDFIIHNTDHERTKTNLALLGIAAGYFCHLEYISNGGLPTAPLSEIAQIARDYVHDVENGIVPSPVAAASSVRQASDVGTGSRTPVSIAVRFVSKHTLICVAF